MADTNKHYVSNRAPLTPSAYIQLPPGAIRARGWLAHQLELQIDGLTGHLDELFDDVGSDSAWLGGDGEDWERGPYYLRGCTALAYATGNRMMIDKITPWIEWCLASQTSDGYFGPGGATSKTHQGEGYNEWWPRMIMLQVMQMHYEATGDDRVIPFMQKFFAYEAKELPNRPLKSWANRRGGDNLDSIHWLYNLTGEQHLLELGKVVFEQTYDWASDLLRDEPIRSHVVNLSQAYKQPGVWYRQSHDERFREAVFTGLELVMKYHGRIDGMHSGDEAEGGKSSVRGTELCAAVEFLHSMEVLLKIFGRPELADRIERVAYNALPTLIKPDWRGHQYFSQPNQVCCTREPHGFDTDHGDDLTFGVLTGYPCCATNMHMGWPKLTHHLWMATPDNGLAAMIYAPCEVTAKVADGTEVKIVTETDYPFKGVVKFRIDPASPVTFPLHMRIPSWCQDAAVQINGQPAAPHVSSQIMKFEREWQPGDEVTLLMPMSIKCTTWENDSVGIERGPLAYALAVGEKWERCPDWRRDEIEDDWPQWQVHASTDWNYAIKIDRDAPDNTCSVEVTDSVPDQPWSPESAPVRIKAKGCKLPQWQMGDYNNAAAPPLSPVTSDASPEEITLLPFGATRLRIAYIPAAED